MNTVEAPPEAPMAEGLEIRLGAAQVTSAPKLPDTRFDSGKLYLYADGGWGVIFNTPAGPGEHELAALEVVITDPDVVDHVITGTATVAQVEPATGRIVATLRGQDESGTPAYVSINATITPRGE